jgi:hypothetical protein
VNRAFRFTLLGLAVVVVLFAATWWMLPTTNCGEFSWPVRLFTYGLTFDFGDDECVRLDELKTRIEIVFGSAALVIVLVGLAFGAGRRSSSA